MEKVAHKIDDKERTDDVKIKDNVPFSKMLLANHVRKGLDLAGYVYPTVIQATAIPIGKSGIDLMVQSKSGTGKTLIFCTIILEAYEAMVREPQALIIVPTREIAVQIESILNQIGKFTQNFRAVSIIGGLVLAEDRKKLQGAKAIVGTPGRLKHLMQNNVINTSELKLLVLDEADKLMTSTFCSDVNHIRELLPGKKQIIACSATFCNNLDQTLAKFMRNPLLISTEKRATLLVGIKQFVYEIAEQNTSILEMSAKLAELQKIFAKISFRQCLIFAGSQSRAESYKNFLDRQGWPCELISGAQDQKTRLEVFKKFRDFKVRMLVTTDLMARGVDSEHVNLVINLEVPDSGATYLHRIGRAGRFGSHGIAVTFLASAKDQEKFARLMSKIGTGMDVLQYPKSDVNHDFWSFSSSEEEKRIFGVFGNEDKENCQQIDTNTYNIEKSDVDGDNLEFQLDEDDNCSNLLQPNGFLRRLPSSNTIDDASSIAVDSEVFRNTRKPTLPSLVNFLIDKTEHQPAKVDLFEEYKKAQLSEDDSNETEKRIKAVELKSLLLDKNDNPADLKKNLFSDYENYKENGSFTYVLYPAPSADESSTDPAPAQPFPSPVDVRAPAQLPPASPAHSESSDTTLYSNSSGADFESPQSSGFDEKTTSEESSGIVTTTECSTEEPYDSEESISVSENEEADDEDDSSLYDEEEESESDSDVGDYAAESEVPSTDDSSDEEASSDTTESYRSAQRNWNQMYWSQYNAIQGYVSFSAFAKQLEAGRY